MCVSRDPLYPVFYVYSLVDSTTGIPFYIGKGKGNRLYCHEDAVRRGKLLKNKHLYNKILKLVSNEVPITYTKLLSNVTEPVAFLEEINQIATIGRADAGTGPLCNLTDGGEGSAGLRVIFNGLRTRGDVTGKNNPMFGKHHSDKTKTVISEKRRDRQWEFNHTPEHRENLKLHNPGGIKTSKEVSQCDIIGNVITTWKSVRCAAKSLHINHANISNALNNHPNWKVGGYIWKYTNT